MGQSQPDVAPDDLMHEVPASKREQPGKPPSLLTCVPGKLSRKMETIQSMPTDDQSPASKQGARSLPRRDGDSSYEMITCGMHHWHCKPQGLHTVWILGDSRLSAMACTIFLCRAPLTPSIMISVKSLPSANDLSLAFNCDPSRMSGPRATRAGTCTL